VTPEIKRFAEVMAIVFGRAFVAWAVAVLLLS
jgi:hypothetical protein